MLSPNKQQARIPICASFVCQNGRFEAMAVLLTATLALHAGEVSHEIVIASLRRRGGVVGERTLQLLHKLGRGLLGQKSAVPIRSIRSWEQNRSAHKGCRGWRLQLRATHIVLLDSDIVLARPLKIVGSNAAGNGAPRCLTLTCPQVSGSPQAFRALRRS